MKKVFLLLLAASCGLAFSCNSKDDKDKTKKETKVKDRDEDAAKDDDETKTDEDKEDNDKTVSNGDADYGEMANDVCNCMGSLTNNMSSRMKNMFVEAANSDDPQQTIVREMQKIKDPEDQQELAREFQKFSGFQDDPEVKDCSKKLERKYPKMDNNKSAQRTLVREMEKQDDCEVITALMKIGFGSMQ